MSTRSQTPAVLVALYLLVLLSCNYGNASEHTGQISAGESHTCTVTSTGLRCWGDGAEGQTGLDDDWTRGNFVGDMSSIGPVKFSSSIATSAAVSVSCGISHTAALFDNGKLLVFGYGGNGRTGQGNTDSLGDASSEMATVPFVPFTAPTAEYILQVSAGEKHTCILAHHGRVKCFGDGTFGKLGTDAIADVGDTAGQIEALGYITFGSADLATQVVAGYDHTCVLFDNKQLRCFGFGADGALGSDATTNTADGGVNIAIAAVPFVLSITGAVQVSASRHTCVLMEGATDIGSVRCFGPNNDGQLGRDDTATVGNGGVAMAALTDISFASTHGAVQVACADQHTCALFNNRQARCWGNNTYNQLGQAGALVGASGGDMAALDFVPIPGGEWTVATVSAGERHTCAQLMPGIGGVHRVRCWGDPFYGQLGADSATVSTQNTDVFLQSATDSPEFRIIPPTYSTMGGFPVRLIGPFSRQLYFFAGASTSTVQLVFTDSVTTTTYVGACEQFKSATYLQCTSPAYTIGDVTATATVGLRVNGTYTHDLGLTVAILDQANVTNATALPHFGPTDGGSAVTLTTTIPLSNTDYRYCEVNDAVAPEVYQVPAVLTTPTTVQCGALKGVPSTRSVNVRLYFSLGFDPLDVRFTYVTGPTLTSIVPNSGPVGGGSTFTLKGSGLTDNGLAPVVRFSFPNGTVAYVDTTGALNVTEQWVTGLTPNMGATAAGLFDLPGDIDVELSLNGGKDFTNGSSVTFNIFANPTLNSVTPSALPAGFTSTVTLVGTGFYNSGGLQVRITAPGIETIVPGTFNSGTGTVTANFPVQLTPILGTVEITFNGVQYTDSRTVFSYYSVTDVEPGSGPLTGGTDVDVIGDGFVRTAGLSCKFGTNVESATYVSATKILCATPPGAATGVVSVNTALDQIAGIFSNGTTPFTYYDQPTIVSLTPRVGPASQNTTIVLNGTSILSGPGIVAYCRIDQEVIIADVVNSTLVCTTTGGSGTHEVFFSLNGKDFISSKKTFIYYSPLGLEPKLGPTTGGSEVVLFGQGFDPSISYCRFGTVVSTQISVAAAQVTCISPPGLAGDVYIELSIDNVTYTQGQNNFTYFDQPTLTSVSPAVGSDNGGYTVTVVGTKFVNHGAATKCQFGAQTVDMTIISPTAGTCVVPAGGGVVNVAVSLSNGAEFTTDKVDFFYVSIVSVFPASGSASGGTLVTISGSGFQEQFRTQLSCRFGTSPPVPATWLDSVRISCNSTVAANPGLAQITVSSNYLEWSNQGLGFTYFQQPVLDLFSPTHGAGKGGTVVSLVGSNFLNAPTIDCKFGAKKSSVVTFVSASSILCISPSGSGSSLISLSFNEQNFIQHPSPFTFFSMLSVSPALGPMEGGTVVDVTGSGFGNAPVSGIRCRVGQQEVAGILVASNLVRCITPPAREGVTNPTIQVTVNGRDYEGNAPFQYYTAPKVTGIEPREGPTYGGTLVTITGTFIDTSALACKFGDDFESIPSPATYVTASQVTCTSMPHTGATVLPQVSQNGLQFHKGEDHTNYTFTVCDPGFYSESHTVECKPCPLGTAVNRRGARSCSKCSLEGYADQLNQTVCTPCPENSIIESFFRDNATLCLCKPGFYEPTGTTGMPCLECPVGAVCPGGTALPFADSKYWMSDLKNQTFIKCPNVEACEGGLAQPCGEGYEGRLCSRCSEGFYASGQSCLKCTILAWGGWILLAVFILASAMLLLMLTGRRATSYAASIHMIAYYAQGMTLIITLPYEWPDSIARAYTWAAAPFIWSVDALAGECFMPFWGFGSKLIFVASLPGAYAVVLFLYYVINRTFVWKRGHREWSSLRDAHIDAFISVLSLVYFVLLINILKVFDCSVQSDGVETLDAAPGQVCFDTWWWLVAPTAAGFMFLYGFGVPLFLFLVIRKPYRRLHQDFLGRYGSVLVMYKLNAPYWEVYVMSEKFLFASSIMFITGYPVFQGLVLLCLIVIGLGVVSTVRPYFLERHNSAQIILRWNLCLVLLMGMVFRIGEFPTPGIKNFAMIMCFAVLIVSFATAGGLGFIDIRTIWRATKRNPKQSAISLSTAIFHPRGKTLLMEWLANRPENVDDLDLIQYFEVHEILSEVVQYVDAAPTMPPDPDMWTLADQSLSAYCSNLCFSNTIPLQREWLTGVVMNIRETNDFELMRTCFLFYEFFGELARFSVYGESEEAIRSIPGFQDLDFKGIQDTWEEEAGPLPGLDGDGGMSDSDDTWNITTSSDGSDDDKSEVELELANPGAPPSLDDNRSERGYLADILLTGWESLSKPFTPAKPTLAAIDDGLPAPSPRIPGHEDGQRDSIHVLNDAELTQEHAQDFVKASLVSINLDSHEATAIKSLMESTSVSHAGHPPDRFELVSVESVTNKRLLRRYNELRADIRAGIAAEGVELESMPVNQAMLLNPHVNEYYLWHGLNAAALESVVQDGFQPGLSNLSGMFGAGTYFAEHFSKSHQYVHTKECDISGAVYGRTGAANNKCTCRPPDDDTIYEILLCRVVLGDPYHARDIMKRTRVAPLKPGSNSSRHDSIFAPASDTHPDINYRLAYNEFIVFDRAQALPSYIVKYRNLGP